MGSMKGSQTQKSSQTNNPPAWALPILQKVAGDAMGMYNSGQGYNTYRGPTQANFSPQRLEGLNRAMMMTGSTGPKISNESIFQTDQIKEIRGLIDQQIAAETARKAAAAAAAAAEAAKKKTTPYRKQDPYQGGRGGDRTSSGQGYAGGGPGGSFGQGGATGSAVGGKGGFGGSSAYGGKGGLY